MPGHPSAAWHRAPAWAARSTRATTRTVRSREARRNWPTADHGAAAARRWPAMTDLESRILRLEASVQRQAYALQQQGLQLNGLQQGQRGAVSGAGGNGGGGSGGFICYPSSLMAVASGVAPAGTPTP